MDKKRETVKLTFREKMYNVFHNTILRNLAFSATGAILVVIGSLNYSSDLVILFCLGMTLMTISLYKLENDLNVQDSKERALKNKINADLEFTLKAESLDNKDTAIKEEPVVL